MTTTDNRLLDRKIDICFTHGDQNGDGTMEGADALALAARIIAYQGEPFGSNKAQALLKGFETFWKHMSAKMDLNSDGTITPDEWRSGMRQAFVENSQGFKEGFRPLAEALFALCDKDGDNKVTPKEFFLFHKAFGTSEENSRIAFAKLDQDQSGHLTVDELLKAWQEYYTSADPEAPGNWLFGDIHKTKTPAEKAAS